MAAGTRTADFAAAMDQLLAGVPEHRTVVMCSATVWWHCHRRIVADAAVLRYCVPVRHLMHDGRLTGHPVSERARLTRDGQVAWNRQGG